ncbi:MAG: hypothetical protein KAG37_03495 [Flavobacteriales bacterium]|nr:hypothetical protein [Flavobacteriales bacterium]
MPLNKINISSNTKVEFDDMRLDELLNLFDVKQDIDTSSVNVETTTEINLPITNLTELKTLVEDKMFSEKFGNLLIDSSSTFSISIKNINSIFDEFISKNKVDYVKRVELVSASNTEISFKIHTKIGITIPLVIELPITIERFLILNFKIKNGVKIFLKLINSFLKFSSNKSIIGNDNNIRLDIREIVEIPKPILHIIDNWLSILKGDIHFDENLIKFDLSFKVDKTPFEKLEFSNSK